MISLYLDTLFPSNTAAGSVLASSTPNLNAYSSFPAGGRHYNNSSPKAPRSPTNSLPSYREAIQNSLCVQSTNTGNFNSNEVLNGYHDNASPLNINQPQRKISSPNLDENILASPGSPMRVDTDDMDLLQRSVLDANGYRRDSFENFRSQNVQNNSLYHVDPSDIFGNPSEARFIKQEDPGLVFLDMETAAAEFAESMDFGMVGESNVPMSGIPFSH